MQRGGGATAPTTPPWLRLFYFVFVVAANRAAPNICSRSRARGRQRRKKKKKKKKEAKSIGTERRKSPDSLLRFFFFWKRKKTEAFITGSRRVDGGQVRHGSGQEKKITPVGFDCRIHERPFSGKESVLGIVGEKQKRDVACRNRRGGEGREREREKNREMSPTPR